MSQPDKNIVSICCGKPLRWVKRTTNTPAVFSPSGQLLNRRVLGKAVRAYVCRGCGKRDRL
jgi:hypothetical protein